MAGLLGAATCSALLALVLLSQSSETRVALARATLREERLQLHQEIINELESELNSDQINESPNIVAIKRKLSKIERILSAIDSNDSPTVKQVLTREHLISELGAVVRVGPRLQQEPLHTEGGENWQKTIKQRLRRILRILEIERKIQFDLNRFKIMELGMM